MKKRETFIQAIQEGYSFKKDSFTVGGAIFNGQCPGCLVKVPLKTINRHGLIAGATGTGKTKTVQVLTEQLSEKGVPVLLMDIKGDLSGLAKPGEMNSHIEKRHQQIGIPYEAKGMPVELLTLSQEPGVRLRATVSEFGPVLFSKILGLNDTQSGIVAVLFKFCDDYQLPLLDLRDVKKILQYVVGEGKHSIEAVYGRISEASVATILRKIIELEQQEADIFFGEKSFDVHDLLRNNPDGNGIISVVRLTDIQNRPKLFSTFMLCLLAEIYSTFPEEGDPDHPKLVIFIDEAHLIFDEASKALLDQFKVIIKLIRSKGVGIFLCTQNPTDIPDVVLSQLGLKIQHALRAFTAKDHKMIRKTAENFPISEFYDTPEILTSLGIGEALVTVLNEKGVPTPLVATLMRAPMSRMGILEKHEVETLVSQSLLVRIYNESIDRESAYEILEEKMSTARQAEHQDEMNRQKEVAKNTLDNSSSLSYLETLSKNTMARQLGRTAVREITRGILGVLGISSSRRYTRR